MTLRMTFRRPRSQARRYAQPDRCSPASRPVPTAWEQPGEHINLANYREIVAFVPRVPPVPPGRIDSIPTLQQCSLLAILKKSHPPHKDTLYGVTGGTTGTRANKVK